MKKFGIIAILFAMMIFMSGCVSTVPQEAISYSEVIEVAGKSTNDLYTKANLWFVDVFNDPRSLIQYSDKSEGVLKGKYYLPEIADGMYRYRVMTILTVETKNGRCKISFDNPTAEITGSMFGRATGSPVERVVGEGSLGDKVKIKWQELVSSLSSALNEEEKKW